MVDLKKHNPVVLAILDGWGILPSWGGNPVSLANPGFMSFLWQNYPHKILSAFSLITNPYGTVGSSEVGYASIGTGRMVQEPLATISQLIKKGDFFRNKALLGGMQASAGRLHLIGLVSDGGVHSHIDHLEALLKMSSENNIKKVYIHAILDGIDVPPRSAYYLLEKIFAITKKYGVGQIASFCGRNFAMNSQQKSDFVIQAVESFSKGKANRILEWRQGLLSYYQAGLFDPEIPPTVVIENDTFSGQINHGDSVVLFNSRFDKTSLLTDMLGNLSGVTLVCFVNQLSQSNFVVAFPFNDITPTLTSILRDHRITQAKITESIKRYNLEYFFEGTINPNGSKNARYIDSDESDDYTKSPGLKASEITDGIIDLLDKGVEFIAAAYANPDVLGHTGDVDALREGVNVLLANVERLYQAVLEKNGTLIVTADHGNAEQMPLHRFNWYGQRHTKNPVPFIIIRPDNKIDLYHRSLQIESDLLSEIAQPKYSLADIAPTVLDLFGISNPAQMTGKSLWEKIK